MTMVVLGYGQNDGDSTERRKDTISVCKTPCTLFLTRPIQKQITVARNMVRKLRLTDTQSRLDRTLWLQVGEPSWSTV